MVKMTVQNEGTNAEIPFAHCPNCSMMHALRDEEKKRNIPMPATCERCGCPMDIKEAKAFGEAQAVGAGAGSD